jgi:hypothetical protein
MSQITLILKLYVYFTYSSIWVLASGTVPDAVFSGEESCPGVQMSVDQYIQL